MISEITSAKVEMSNGGGKIKRPSFKSSRGGGQNNGAGRGYRTVRVKVPSTVVTELASKFNAVVVDASSGDTAQDIIKKVNKSLAQGAAVRATVEKFESTSEKKHSMVVVRTNSDRQQAAAVSVAVKKPPSLVKQRMEQFQTAKKLSKPSILTPKPNLANMRREGRRQLNKKDCATITMELSNKHKRLSIARDPDAQLESVLNTTPPPPLQQMAAKSEHRLQQEQEQEKEQQEQEQQQPVDTVLPSPPKIQPKPNSSFLHGQKMTTTATGDGARSIDVEEHKTNFLHQTYKKTFITSTDKGDGFGDTDLDGDDKTAVVVHDYNYIGQTPSHAIYEELCDLQMSTARPADAPDPSPLPDVVLENTYYDNSNDDHYTTIGDGGEQNIYEYVNTALAAAQKENRKRPADEDGRYETVQAPPTPPPKVALPAVVFDVPSSSSTSPTTPLPADDNSSEERRRLSDSSSIETEVDIMNSIYNTSPPSETTSSGITTDSDCALRNNTYYIDEEWVDIDNTSDELQEIILFHPKSNISDAMTNKWSIQVQKQLDKANVSISSQSVISFVKDVPEKFGLKKSPCDFGNEQLLSVILKTVFLEEKFESQELSLFVDNETKENTNTISQDIPEGIYADYDSFESDDSWDDCNDGEKINRVPYPCENRDLPPPPSQQNIDRLVPLVKKARNRIKNRWSFGSLNRMWKLSVGNLADLGNKSYDNKSDKSFDKKINSPSVKCNSLSSSTFYLNGTIGRNIENSDVHASVKKTCSPPSSLDSRRLSVARPSSPPPPPPVKRHSTGTNAYDSFSRLNTNSKGRPASLMDKNNTNDPLSENGRSNQGSDLYIRFADEPLYQFYTADVSERSKSILAGDINVECDGYEEISSITSRPSALELITPCPTGHGQHRSLWCEVPEVKYKGIIDTLNPRERKLQEAKFELITSEASYFKSLTVLEKHFVNSHSMNDVTILSKDKRKVIFGNVSTVRKCSEKLLSALEKCWQDNILLTGLCEILYKHSKDNFEIFVKYCSNQIYIDRTLKSLRENFKFNEALQRLESDAKCQSLSLHSFLMLPMQRITRLPLLVDAILSQMDPSENALEYQMCELTLASLNTIVQNCNESTRKLERCEEMLLLSRQFEFSKKEMKAISVASSSRWLVRSGSMSHLISPDAKLTFSRKLIRPPKLYFFLFNDMFFIAKRKSVEIYSVVDYCARNFVQMVDATELVISSNYKNLLMLTILENHEGKTIEMLLSCDSESSKKRWIEAMSPPISSNPDETLYNEWDCPQVFTEHPYTPIQPDELALQKGDTVKVLTKMNDGWYHGERIRDGEKGWFPGNYTSEIASQHARAKNLKQRYRLLAMSGSYLQSQQDKIKKK